MENGEIFTSGCISGDEDQHIILGTNKGRIYKINPRSLDEKQAGPLLPDSILKDPWLTFAGHIRAIRRLTPEKILVGFRSGEIYEINIESKIQINIRDQSSRYGLWRILVLDEKNFVVSGKYGYLHHFFTVNSSEWRHKELEGHTHSIFCLDKISPNTFITVGWNGTNKKWTRDEAGNISGKRINPTLGNMQRAAAVGSGRYAIIHNSGTLNLYEFKPDDDTILPSNVTTFTVPSGMGRDVIYYDDRVMFGSDEQIVRLNITNYDLESVKIGVAEFLIRGANCIIIGNKNLYNYSKLEFSPISEVDKWTYAKVGLIGSTGCGKSTLCHMLKFKNYDPKTSTFGRKIWRLNEINHVPLKENTQILLLDVAGQKEQLYTSFPRFSECSIIFACFRHTSSEELENILLALKKVQDYTKEKCKFYLIGTWCDSGNVGTEGYPIEKRCEELSLKMVPELRFISTRDGIGIDKIEEILQNEIDWKNLPQVSETHELIKVRTCIENLRTGDNPWLLISEFRRQLDEKSIRMTYEHLKFILGLMEDQGEIDLLLSLQLIIVKSDVFNIFWSKIPTFVQNSQGFINSEVLLRKLRESSDLKDSLTLITARKEEGIFQACLDEALARFEKYEFALLFPSREKYETVIFPDLFKPTTTIPDLIKSKLNFDHKRTISVDETTFQWFDFLDRLKMIEYVKLGTLQFVALSQKQCIFTVNQTEVILYISIDSRQTGLDHSIMDIIYIIMGDNEYKISKIQPIIENQIKNMFKKKMLSSVGDKPPNSKPAVADATPNVAEDNDQKKKIPSSKKKYALIITSHPRGVKVIRPDIEIREIQKILSSSTNTIDLELVTPSLATTIADLRRRLFEKFYYIVQFSSHGNFNNIMLEDEEGFLCPLEKDVVFNIFKIVEDRVKCIFLNCCESITIAQELANLIDVTIGMKKTISDPAAIQFASDFYQALCSGNTFEKSFENGLIRLPAAEKDTPGIFKKK